MNMRVEPLDTDGLARRRSFAITVVREAAVLAVDFWSRRESLGRTSKGPHNIVTEADEAVEAFIRERLAQEFPDDAVLGEEGGLAGDGSSQAMWVIDPIDGTQEFARGTRNWCIVLAVVDAEGCAVGVVFDPLGDELFEADRTSPALLNGKAITASKAISLSEGVVTVEYSPHQGADVVLEILRRLLSSGGTFVRGGSGALGIAYVACGRSLGFVEAHMQPWDCLASMLIVRQAGGSTNDFIGEGSMDGGGPVVAACAGLFGEVSSLLD